MAAPMADTSAESNMDKLCNIEASVTTGFELVAKEEAEEKFKVEVTAGRGNIAFHIPVRCVKQVLELGCVDHVRVVMHRVPTFSFTQDEADCLIKLRHLVGKVDWEHGLKVWHQIFTFKYPIKTAPDEDFVDFGKPDLSADLPKRKTAEKQSKRQWKKQWKKKREMAKNEGGNVEDGTLVGNESNSGGGDERDLDVTMEKGLDDTEKDASTSRTESVGEKNLEGTQKESEKNERTDMFLESDHSQNASSAVQLAAGMDHGEEEVTENADGVNQENSCKKARVRKNPWNDSRPSFRVTCKRTGNNHCFDSMAAAANFGGAIYRYFGWNVQMKNFDIEVLLNIEDDDVTVGIGLTKDSLHRRNIGHFGPTTLRPTIAYNMLRMCKIQCADLVCDPMCGSGSIPIQAAISWPEAHHVCGELAKKALVRTQENLHDLKKTHKNEKKRALNVDPLLWDVCRLPLKDSSVDVFITDLPFGKRMGSKLDNWKLYPGALREMARVVRPDTGRVCLLTQDKKCMIKTLQTTSRYWRRTSTLGINIGGLAAGVYLLNRTTHSVDILSEGKSSPDRQMDTQSSS